MKITGREFFGIALIFVLGLLSFGAWQAFFIVVTTPGIYDIWLPILWFSILAVLFFFGTVLWSNLASRIAGVVLIFLPGLFFMRSWEFIAAGLTGTVFIFWSSKAIAQETNERIRFRFFKSARVGQFLFVFGLALAVTGGYYVFLKNASWEELVPRFRIGQELTRVIFKVAGTVNPSFAKLSQGDMTVDEFLLSLEQNKPEGRAPSEGDQKTKTNEQVIIDSLPLVSQYLCGQSAALFSDSNQREIAQELFLESGREQIATLVGRKVVGGEKISNVLSLALQNKLIAFMNGGQESQRLSSQAVPFFLSLLLFLTILSLASIFVPVCILAAELLFLLSLRMGWLTVVKISVEQEKLIE